MRGLARQIRGLARKMRGLARKMQGLVRQMQARGSGAQGLARQIREVWKLQQIISPVPANSISILTVPANSISILTELISLLQNSVHVLLEDHVLCKLQLLLRQLCL